MSNVTSTFRSVAGQVAANPTIYHVTLTTANTEYSQLLNNGTKKILIKFPSTVGEYRYSWVAGGTGGVSDEYVSLPAGTVINIDGINFSGTIYLRANKSAQVVQIEEWT